MYQVTALVAGPMAAVTGARRGRRDLTGARLIDPLTGPLTPGRYTDVATPIYDEVVAALGSPFGAVPAGPVVAVETPTQPIQLRLPPTVALPVIEETVPFGAAVEVAH